MTLTADVNNGQRCDWMAQGKFGLMVHYLPGAMWPEHGQRISDVNALADQFNLDRFIADVAASGADWLIFTVGQNTLMYLSPNTLLERWGGPGICSRRDLIGEIAAAMHRLGKRCICYAPCEVNANKAVHEAFQWNVALGTDQGAFQERYTSFITEWALRWGKKLDGWWFDGCYGWPEFSNSKMNWPLWYHASRAGNHNAALSFNDGSFCCGITVYCSSLPIGTVIGLKPNPTDDPTLRFAADEIRELLAQSGSGNGPGPWFVRI